MAQTEEDDSRKKPNHRKKNRFRFRPVRSRLCRLKIRLYRLKRAQLTKALKVPSRSSSSNIRNVGKTWGWCEKRRVDSHAG